MHSYENNILESIHKEEYIHWGITSKMISYYNMAADEGNIYAINKIIENYYELWGMRKTKHLTNEHLKKIQEYFIAFYKKNISKVNKKLLKYLSQNLTKDTDFEELDKCYFRTDEGRQDLYIKADKGRI